MGMFPRAHAAYGYALGGPHTKWEVQGLGEWDSLDRPWISDVENEDVEDYDTSILRTPLLADGLPEEELEGKYSWDLESILRERRNLKLDAFGHGGYSESNYALISGEEQTARAYVPEAIDFTVPKGADENLSWALSVLDIVPVQEKAAWIVYPSYG